MTRIVVRSGQNDETLASSISTQYFRERVALSGESATGATIPLARFESDVLAGRMRQALHGRERFRELAAMRGGPICGAAPGRMSIRPLITINLQNGPLMNRLSLFLKA